MANLLGLLQGDRGQNPITRLSDGMIYSTLNTHKGKVTTTLFWNGVVLVSVNDETVYRGYVTIDE